MSFFAVRKFELTDCSLDVMALVSHAVQERLKTLVEKLGCIAEHRQEQFKVCHFIVIGKQKTDLFLQNNPHYVVYQDVKAQVQFLQELDRIEKKRHEEQEREVLIKAAKVRFCVVFCRLYLLTSIFVESVKDGRPRSHCHQGKGQGNATTGNGRD